MDKLASVLRKKKTKSSEKQWNDVLIKRMDRAESRWLVLGGLHVGGHQEKLADKTSHHPR